MLEYTFYTKRLKNPLITRLEPLVEEMDIEHREIISNDESIILAVDTLTCIQNEKIARVITDVVQKYTINKVCDSYLASQKEISKVDKNNIKESFIKTQYVLKQDCFKSYTYYLVYMPIYNEISLQRQINIDGWMMFRARKYEVLIKDLLEQFIMDYNMKKEILTFIKLMREINSLTTPRDIALNIVYGKDGTPKIYNEKMLDVTKEYIKKYCEEFLLDSTLTMEDYILHILISVSPRQIKVHLGGSRETVFLKTLEIVFENSIVYCDGCEFCIPKTSI